MNTQENALPYDSRQIANCLIEISDRRNQSMSIMRLLKLAYMSHGWTLAIYDEPLVNDYVQAWRYGPVIPSIYYAFRPFGVYGLKAIPIVKEETIDSDDYDFIEAVYDLYKDLSGTRLSQLTHILGGPWHKTYEPGKLGIVIPNELISDHFKDKLARIES